MMDDLWIRAQQLLENRYFVDYTRSFDRRPLIKLVNELNGLRMLLIHWSTLVRIQRIPHSDKNLTVDTFEEISKYGAERCEIFMVNHQWLRPRLHSNEFHPDSIDNEKAKVINEFTKWRRTRVNKKTGIHSENILLD